MRVSHAPGSQLRSTYYVWATDAPAGTPAGSGTVESDSDAAAGHAAGSCSGQPRHRAEAAARSRNVNCAVNCIAMTQKAHHDGMFRRFQQHFSMLRPGQS